jgi:hypothetical protein
MLFIFPTGHEETHARRFPWVTTCIVVLNLALFVLLLPAQRMGEQIVGSSLERAVAHLEAHPNLAVPPFLSQLLSRHSQQKLASARAEAGDASPEEQATLDALVDELALGLHNTPSFALGYRPADANLLGLLTHQFLHGGWLHLLGNM